MDSVIECRAFFFFFVETSRKIDSFFYLLFHYTKIFWQL